MTRLSESDLSKVVYETNEGDTSLDEKGESKARVPGFDSSELNIDLILYSDCDDYNIFGKKRTRVFRKEATYISR